MKGEVKESLVIGGGPVPTACATVAKFGMRARFVGKIGDDFDGEIVLRGLREAGVDTQFMIIDRTVITPRAYIWIDSKDKGTRTVALDISRFTQPSEDELDERLVLNCSALLVDGRAADACLKALRIAKGKGIFTFLDTGSVRPHFKEILKLTDFAIVSHELVKNFFSNYSLKDAAGVLMDEGARYVIITTGASVSAGGEPR